MFYVGGGGSDDGGGGGACVGNCSGSEKNATIMNISAMSIIKAPTIIIISIAPMKYNVAAVLK